jgi:peptidoglycan/xylan/chitin deacetylase (PgdA/CDA1 family)
MLQEVVAFVVRWSGMSLLITNIQSKKATIIFYHDPPPDVLDRHLGYLSKRYNFIPLNRLINAIYSRDWSAIPPKSLVVTFDDGHKGNYNLLEVFKKYKVVPTIYLCTQIANTYRQFWFERVKRKEGIILKKYPNKERLLYLERHYGFRLTKEFSATERDALNSHEIVSMKGSVDFQSHSRFHPMLTTCEDEECKSEIVQSKADLGILLGNDCHQFSYPNGDYSEREVEYVKKAGYLSARTVDVGWTNIQSDPYRLKAMCISDDGSNNLLAAELTGITGLIKELLKFFFVLLHPQLG